MVLEEFGYALPKTMRSAELFVGKYHNEQILEPVPHTNLARTGDLFFFQQPHLQLDNYQELKTLHLAICVEEKLTQLAHVHRWTKSGNYTSKKNAYSVWPLADFFESKHYNVLYGIRRVKQ